MSKKRIFTTYEKLTAPLRAMYHQSFDSTNFSNLILVKKGSRPFYAVLLDTEEVLFLVKIMKAGSDLIPIVDTGVDGLFDNDSDYNYPAYDD